MFGELKSFRISGTTSANTNEGMRTKPENPWRSEYVFPVGFYAKGVYVPAVLRTGLQYKNDAETMYENNGSTTILPSQIRSVRVSPSTVLLAFIDANGFLKIRGGVISKSGNDVEWGSILQITAVTTAYIGVTATKEGFFAVSFRKADTEVYVVSGSISPVTGAITLINTIDISNEATSTAGTTICYSREEFLTVAYVKSSTDAGVLKTFPISSEGILGDAVSTVEFSSSVNLPSLASYANGYGIVAFQSPDETNDPIKVKTFTVGSEGETLTGNEISLAGTAGAASSIRIRSLRNNSAVVCWIDNSDPHMRACTFDEEEMSWGSELAITTQNSDYLDFDFLNDTTLVAAWKNTSKTNYMYSVLVTLSGETLTASTYMDTAVEATSNYVSVVSLSEKSVLLAYQDFSASRMKLQYGEVKSNLIEVRSTTASVAFEGYLVSLGQDGLGALACKKITGTTNSSADTVMSTKPTNMFYNTGDPNNIIVLFSDTRLYIENDASVKPKMSGVASGSIDVRSTTTAQAFTAYVVKVTNITRKMEVA